MTTPRIYTYKITFEEIPHWYWGVHKEKKHGEIYLGSPVTHRWMWEFYTPKIQILELFPYTDDGWEEANLVEDRLILPDLNNPLCLNENYGGRISLRVCREVGNQNVTVGRGFFSPSYQGSDQHRRVGTHSGSKVGALNVSLSRGVFSQDYQGSDKHRQTGRRSGQQAVDNKTGVHSDEWKNSSKRSEVQKRAGKAGGLSTSSQVWESLVDGFRSTAGNVAKHNRAKGWDPNARFRVK